MSIDIVDDLHNAEDRIGLLEYVLRGVLEQALMPKLDKVPVTDDEKSYENAIRTARVALDAEVYCRPSCIAEKDYKDDDPEYEHDPDCGCPCGHGEED